MKCNQCGTELFEGNTFCHVCGASVAPATPQTPPVEVTPPSVNPYVNGDTVIAPPPAPVKKSKKPLIIAGIALAAVAILAIALFFIFGNNGGEKSYEDVIEKYMENTFTGHLGGNIDLMPDELAKSGAKEEDMSVSELKEMLDKQGKQLMAQYATLYGSDWEYSYKILSADEITGEEFDDLKDKYDTIDVKLKEAKVVEVEVNMKGSKKNQTFTSELLVIKVGSGWYLGSE